MSGQSTTRLSQTEPLTVRLSRSSCQPLPSARSASPDGLRVRPRTSLTPFQSHDFSAAEALLVPFTEETV